MNRPFAKSLCLSLALVGLAFVDPSNSQSTAEWESIPLWRRSQQEYLSRSVASISDLGKTVDSLGPLGPGSASLTLQFSPYPWFQPVSKHPGTDSSASMYNPVVPDSNPTPWVNDAKWIPETKHTEVLLVSKRLASDPSMQATRLAMAQELSHVVSLLTSGTLSKAVAPQLPFCLSARYSASKHGSGGTGVAMPASLRYFSFKRSSGGRMGHRLGLSTLTNDIHGRLAGQLASLKWLTGRLKSVWNQPPTVQQIDSVLIVHGSPDPRVWMGQRVPGKPTDPQTELLIGFPIADANGPLYTVASRAGGIGRSTVTIPIQCATLQSDGSLAFETANEFRWPAPMPRGTDTGAVVPNWRPQEALVVTQQLLNEYGGCVAVWLLPGTRFTRPTFVLSNLETLAAADKPEPVRRVAFVIDADNVSARKAHVERIAQMHIDQEAKIPIPAAE